MAAISFNPNRLQRSCSIFPASVGWQILLEFFNPRWIRWTCSKPNSEEYPAAKTLNILECRIDRISMCLCNLFSEERLQWGTDSLCPTNRYCILRCLRTGSGRIRIHLEYVVYSRFVHDRVCSSILVKFLWLNRLVEVQFKRWPPVESTWR